MITDDLSKELNAYLENAIALEGADKGMLQVFDPKEEVLRIVAYKGFKEEFLEIFKFARPFDNSACGRAAGILSPVIISDVNHDIGFTPNRGIAKAAGFRAVKSVPIIGKNSELLGVLSTHYKEPKGSWDIDKISPVIKAVAKFIQAKEINNY